jgi:hypothetical protein
VEGEFSEVERRTSSQLCEDGWTNESEEKAEAIRCPAFNLRGEIHEANTDHREHNEKRGHGNAGAVLQPGFPEHQRL